MCRRASRAESLLRADVVRSLRAAAAVVLLALVSSCGTVRAPDWMRPGGGDDDRLVDLVAVMPIREVAGRAEAMDSSGERRLLDEDAGRAVTAQIYGYLAEQTRYRFVPDMSVDAYLEENDFSDPVMAARRVAEEFQADAVLFGTVYRFQDRVGTRYAASAPASVSFELQLYSSLVDEVVWSGRFDETQVPLTSNFLNAWMFWRAGPYWFSSRELAGLGVEKLLRSIPPGRELLADRPES